MLLRQLIEQVVAEPVVATTITESDFELRPRAIEEVGPVDVLLNQNFSAAAVCITYNRPANQSVSYINRQSFLVNNV